MLEFIRSLTSSRQTLLIFVAVLVGLIVVVMPNVRSGGQSVGRVVFPTGRPVESTAQLGEDATKNPYVFKPFLTADISNLGDLARPEPPVYDPNVPLQCSSMP